MFEKIARFSVRFRWLIIIAWIAAVPLLTASLPKIADVIKNDNSAFLPKNSPTQKAADIAAQFQKKDTASGTLLIASRADGPLSETDNIAIDKIITEIKTVKSVTEVQDHGLSKDSQAHQYAIGLNGDAFGPAITDVISNIRAKFNTNLPTGLQVNLAGQLAQAVDSEKANNSGKNKTEIYNVIFIIALLLFVFRAFLAPIVTLLPAALSLIIAQPIIAESTRLGVQVSFITEILLVVLLLGAGTDYGLFLVFRMREELRKGLTPKEAVVKALGRVGESITFSAATVAAALLCLVLASFGIYKGLGPALAIGLGVMLLSALTFLPALLSILGRAVFWPSKTVKTAPKIGLWGRVADKVIEKPKLMLIAGAIVFAGLSFGVVGYKTAGFTSDPAPAGSDSIKGDTALAKHFPAATNNPQALFFVFDKPVWDNLDAVYKAQTELSNSPAFTAVSGPFSANGFTFTAEQIKEVHESASTSPASVIINQFISPDGKTVQFYGVSSAGESGSVKATAATPALRAELDKVAKSVGAVDNQVYGQDSAAYDIGRIANSDLKKIIPLVLIIIAVLLAIMLKSLVAPWYLIATVGFSYLAALGFAMLVFVHFGHADGLNFILPFMMFIFSMALGEDYNILVMSRIREEAHGNVSLKQAVTKAIGITGSTVTSAGIILAGTFAVFGLVGGSEQMKEIGFSIAFGILLDTFFVRTLLVPSIVTMLGKWNWWPSKIKQND